MAINLEKLKTLVTGKSKEQRESEGLAKDIARRQISKAQIEERARQMERVAIKREQIRADAMIRKEEARFAPRPKMQGGGGFVGSIRGGGAGGGYSSPVGSSSIIGGFGGGSKPQGTFNVMTGKFSSPSVPKVKRVKHRRARPRRKARRVVYVRKYV